MQSFSLEVFQELENVERFLLYKDFIQMNFMRATDEQVESSLKRALKN